jgi:hypothetical protein
VAPPPSAVGLVAQALLPVFPIPAISPESCSPLPASLSHAPTPHSTFIENKSSTPIRPSGDRTVEALFLSFSAVKSASISACFFRFYCSVGRGSQKTVVWLNADYLVLTAICQRPCASRRCHTLADSPYRINSEIGHRPNSREPGQKCRHITSRSINQLCTSG